MKDTFAVDLRGILTQLQGKAETLCRQSAQVLFNEMSSGGRYSPGTPVGNPTLWKVPRPHIGGYARGSWAAALNGEPGQASGNPGDAAAQVTATIGTLKVGQTLYATNRAPYIRRLEFAGHSTQAPDGFVRPAVEAWREIVTEVAANLRRQ